MTVVAMTREVGSLRTEVAAGVAKRLGLEIIRSEVAANNVARRLGVGIARRSLSGLPDVSRARLIVDILRARGHTYRYGADRSQRADLHLPGGPGPHPVMVLLHGGSWRKRYGRVVMRGLARDLVRRGWEVFRREDLNPRPLVCRRRCQLFTI